MSVFDKSPLLDEISGKTENLVFSSWRGIPYVKRRVYPINTYTTDRDIARSALARLVTIWKQSPESLRESWRFYHSQKLNSGYNRFISRTYAEERSLSCLGLLPPSPVQGLNSVNIIPTGWQTEIKIHFTPSIVPAGKSMYIFLRPSPFALDRSVELYYKFFISGTTSPVTILLPYSDSSYQFHACLQDNVSQLLSASICTEKYILGDIMQVAHVYDQKPSGTAGGTSTSGVWHIRDLNQFETNIPGLSLSSNQITIPKGSYQFFVSAPTYKSGRCVLGLYDVLSEAYITYGSTTYQAVSDTSAGRAFQSLYFAFDSESIIEVRHYIDSGYALTGLGINNIGTGIASIYTTVDIFRLT